MRRRTSMKYPPQLTADEEMFLGRLACKGDKFAQDKLVEHNLGFVDYLVKRCYQGWNLPDDDKIQAGRMGLIRAATDFDPDKGVRFTSYAAFWIRQSMGRACYEDFHVTTPERYVQGIGKISRAKGTFYARYGRKPNNKELQEASGLDNRVFKWSRQFEEAQNAQLDAPVHSDKGTGRVITRGEMFSDPKEYDHSFIWLKETVEKALGSIDSRLAYVFWQHQMEEKQLKEIGKELGFSRERARQLFEKALTLLRRDKRLKLFWQEL